MTRNAVMHAGHYHINVSGGGHAGGKDLIKAKFLQRQSI
jgi:hypothetical protein